MGSTALILALAIVISVPSQGTTLLAPAGPAAWQGEPGRSSVRVQTVAMIGAKSYRVLQLGIVPTVGVVISRLGLTSGVALGADCTVILTSAHQKYSPTDNAEYNLVRGQNVGRLSFRADGSSSTYPIVAEGEEIFTGTTFAKTDPYAHYRDLRVFRTYTSTLPGQGHVCHSHFKVASKAFMRTVTSKTAPFRVIVIAHQGVCIKHGQNGQCLLLEMEKSIEDCEARNPHFPGAVYRGVDEEPGLFLLACDTSMAGGPSGGVVAVVDPAGKDNLIIVGIISASTTAKGIDGLPFHPYDDEELNVSIATPISDALIEALCRHTDQSMLQPGACPPVEPLSPRRP